MGEIVPCKADQPGVEESNLWILESCERSIVEEGALDRIIHLRADRQLARFSNNRKITQFGNRNLEEFVFPQDITCIPHNELRVAMQIVDNLGGVDVEPLAIAVDAED